MTTRIDVTDTASGNALLLRRRMTVLGLDIDAWARHEPVLFSELEAACAGCASRQDCAEDLVARIDNPTGLGWQDYCPNVAKLNMMVALQFY